MAQVRNGHCEVWGRRRRRPHPCFRWAYEGGGRFASLPELRGAVLWKSPRSDVRPPFPPLCGRRTAHLPGAVSSRRQPEGEGLHAWLVPASLQGTSALQGTACCLGSPRSGPWPWFCGRRHIFRHYTLILQQHRAFHVSRRSRRGHGPRMIVSFAVVRSADFRPVPDLSSLKQPWRRRRTLSLALKVSSFC